METMREQLTIPELIEEMREHLSSGVALCQLCGGALTMHREFTPDSDYSTEKDDVYVTGPCVESDREHARKENEIIAYADGQMLEREVIAGSVVALCEEIVRLRDWLQHIHDEKNHSGYTLRHYAWRALEGQTVEEWASE